MKVKSLIRVRLLATPWTAAYQAPPSMGFSRQEYWSGVPLPYHHIMCIRGQSFNLVQLFATPWTAARQASLSITNSQSLLKLMSIASGMHPTISSSVVPFSSRLQAFPASGSFPVSPFFPSGGQSIEVSASAQVLPVNIRDWFPLGLTGWISLWESQFLGRLIRSPGGPQGERGLEFSRRRKGQTFFSPLHSLGL